MRQNKNETNQEQPTYPIRIDIDAEQWRRDIETFAETTNQALQTIVSQLSNPGSARQASPPQNLDEKFPEPSDIINDDLQRLSQLKAQLAQRMTRSACQ